MKPNQTKKNGLTFTAQWLGEENLSVVVTGPKARLAALDARDPEWPSNLAWPSDAEISKLAGCKVRFFDGGDNLLEAIYRRPRGRPSQGINETRVVVSLPLELKTAGEKAAAAADVTFAEYVRQALRDALER